MLHILFAKLQVRLIILIVIASIPVFGLTIATGLEQRQVADTATRAEVLRVARTAAFNQQQTIHETRALLTTLGQIPAVRTGDTAMCSAYLSNLLNGFPRYANFGVIELDGRVSCSGVPLNGPVYVSDRGYFQQALETLNFSAGSYQIGRITGKPSINFGYPIFEADGDLRAVVFAALDLSWLDQLAVESKLPPGSTLTVIDHNGTILVRHPEPEQWVGQSLPETGLVDVILTQKEGTAEIVGLDGVSRLYGFMALDHTTLAGYVSVGIPTSVVFAETDTILALSLIGLSGVVTLFLILTWIGSELFILHPVRSLLEVTKRLATGDLNARVGWSGGPVEFSTLAHAFDEMAASLYAEREILRQHNRRLGTLHELDRGILTAQPLAQVAETALERVLHDVPASVALITRFDFEADEGTVLSSHDQNETQQAPGSRFALSIFSDQEIKELQSGHMQAIEDVIELPRPPTTHPLRIGGIRSYVRMPLVSQGELIGAFFLGAGQPHVFDSIHVAVIREVANQLAIALQHASYRERIQRYVDELEQRVLERTAELEQAKNYVEAILNHISDGLALIGIDGIIQQTNPAFDILLGYQVDEAYGFNLTELVETEDAGNLAAMLERAAKTGQAGRTELVIQRKDGKSIHVDLALATIPNHDNEQASLICSLRDITERKQMEEALAKERSLLHAVINTAPNSIYVKDTDSRFLLVNPRVVDDFGATTPDEVIGKTDFDFSPEDAAAERYANEQAIFRSGQPLIGKEETYVDRSGTTRWVITNKVPLYDGHGEIIGLVGVNHDITEQKRAEADLRRAYEKEKELNILKSRFVSMVSHEFRNPLASILLSTESLKHYADRLTEDKKAEKLDRIINRVQYLTGLMEDVLTFSRGEEVGVVFNPASFDLEALCRTVVQEQQSMAGVLHRLELSTTGDCTGVIIDEKLIRQLITNLLSNAIKYSPNGGEVRFELSRDDQQIIIQVQDEGLGIPEEDQMRLFEAFHRASNVGTISGTGLGLSIVRRAVEAHEGTITFKSAVGVGTTFTVSIPMIKSR